MDADTIKKNYSKLGASLIERLYSSDYLSIGGTDHPPEWVALALPR